VPSELTDHRQLSPTVNQYLPGNHEPFRVISKQNIFFTESYSILVPFRQERTRIPPKEPVIIISLELAFAYLYMPVISLSRHLTQASYSVSHQVVPENAITVSFCVRGSSFLPFGIWWVSFSPLSSQDIVQASPSAFPKQSRSGARCYQWHMP
jgi:hypothetical protein